MIHIQWTPLEITTLLNIQAVAGWDQLTEPQQAAIKRFQDHGLIRREKIALTAKGSFYVDALLTVPLPTTTYTIEFESTKELQ